MKRYILTIGALAISLVAFSQSDPGSQWISATCHALVGETKYTCRIDREAVVGGPTWDSSKPLPLSFAQAERIARTELAKLTKDEGAWEVMEFSVNRAELSVNRASGSANWYYGVEMRPISRRTDHRYFNVYLNADGKPGSFYEER